jgi:Ca2+/H+ antiporter, TMEM165/GDT1 family
MDSLLITLISVLLAESAARTQFLVAGLTARFGDNRKILLAIILATAANSVIAAFAGSFVALWISEDPVRLFIGMAYIFAAISMLWRRRPVDMLEKWKTGPVLTSFVGLFVLQFGDKGQFIVLAQAAQSHVWGWTALGGFLGTMLGLFPAILFKEKLEETFPLHAIRKVAGVLFLVFGAYLALGAWRLL